jgi:hypothetical protein
LYRAGLTPAAPIFIFLFWGWFWLFDNLKRDLCWPSLLEWREWFYFSVGVVKICLFLIVMSVVILICGEHGVSSVPLWLLAFFTCLVAIAESSKLNWCG